MPSPDPAAPYPLSLSLPSARAAPPAASRPPSSARAPAPAPAPSPRPALLHRTSTLNKWIEERNAGREHLELNFRWTRRSLAVVGFFGLAVPILVYKGIVREFEYPSAIVGSGGGCMGGMHRSC
ncbi:hypothetical protein SORBI_3001G164350 [Sorghum bicolor]|uniref:Uncharacterized protein n=1 Tax=Sorghum bicolor TaxID=4558 RepID=A0A1Z5S5Z6_SORBI|nr:hypothetical protein SORBI_3001G164350 [Sorghum bicolor]